MSGDKAIGGPLLARCSFKEFWSTAAIRILIRVGVESAGILRTFKPLSSDFILVPLPPIEATALSLGAMRRWIGSEDFHISKFRVKIVFSPRVSYPGSSCTSVLPIVYLIMALSPCR